MKENELRLGNKLTNFLGEVFDCNAETIRSFESNYFPYGKPLPIPLTEEWLLKFGFEKKGVNRTRWTFWKIDLVEDEKGIYSFDESRIYIDIKYVHQLQNLYFALTNEELTYEQQK